MTENFLCQKCRIWLNHNQHEIPNRCHESYKLAAAQYRVGDLDTALQSIGSVFEMSKMMLKSKSFCNQYASDWLLTSSEVLVRILNDVGKKTESGFIHRKTVSLINGIQDEIEMSKVTPVLANIGRKAGSNRRHLSLVH